MRDSAKMKGKCKKAASSPSKMHLSTSMSSQENEAGAAEENVEDDDDVVIKIDSSSSKNSVDKTSRRRSRFWFFSGGNKSRGDAVSDRMSATHNPEPTGKRLPQKPVPGGPELSASPSVSVSVTTPHVTRVNSNSSKTATPKMRKAPSRFSLRRLFYGNPLLAQPFLQAQAGFVSASASHQPGPSGTASSQRRGYKGSSSSGKTHALWFVCGCIVGSRTSSFLKRSLCF